MPNGAISATVWTDSTITAGVTAIRGTHLNEIRTALNNLQSYAANVTNCGYNPCQACQACQTCQSCQACQTTSQCTTGCQNCQTCQSCQTQCNCNCNTGGCCFIDGTLVLMGDGTFKKIEDVKVGDFVVGLNGTNRVIKLVRMPIGSYVPLWKFSTNDLFFAAGHPFWITRGFAEDWGVWNLNEFLYEKKYNNFDANGVYIEGPDEDPIPLFEPTMHAHLEGWKLQRPELVRSAGGDTIVNDIVVDGSGSYTANGYLVSGTRHKGYPYQDVKWEKTLQWLRDRGL